MTIVPHRDTDSADVDTNRLARFAELVARSSLGSPEVLANQSHTKEPRQCHHPVDDDPPPIDPARLFAVGQHLQSRGLNGSAELTYRAAATRSADAAAALADLLERDGRVAEAHHWYEQAWQSHDSGAGLRIAVERWSPDRSDEAEEILDSVIADRRRHTPDGHLGDIAGTELLVRKGDVRAALLAGWHDTGSDRLARAIIIRLARTTMEHLEVQYEPTDLEAQERTAPTEWDEYPPGSPLWWRPPGWPVTYRLRARWRDAAPSFVPEVIRTEILFVVANACFSAGGLISWEPCQVEDFVPVRDRHSMTVPTFFERVSKQCSPVDREVAGSLAELAEVDVGIRILRAVVLGSVGVTELPKQVAEKRVIGPRKDHILSRVRALAGYAHPTSLDNRTAPAARRAHADVAETRVVLAQVRQQYGENVRSMSDGHIQHLCAVRGRRNTLNLIDQVVRMSGGSDTKVRELLQTVLGYLDILLLFRASRRL